MKTQTAMPSVSRAAIVLRIFLCFIVFLLPIKFGSLAMGKEQAQMPMTWLEWLLFDAHPNFLLPALCGIALLATLAIHRQPFRMDKSAVPVAVWSLLLLSGFAGLVHTTEWDYAIQWLWHIGGLVCLLMAIWRSHKADPLLYPILTQILAATALLCALHGGYQHFWGRKEMLEAARQALADGSIVDSSGTFLAKMEQTRVSGTFIDPNVYASLLLLLAPLTLLRLHEWGSHFEPRKVSRILFVAFGAAVFAGAFYWSGSRGALAGAMGGLCIGILCLPVLRRWRAPLLIAAAVCAVALIAIVASGKIGRGTASASARLEYCRVAATLFHDAPFCGVGLGEFFPWYQRLKAIGAEEVRDPHCFLLSIACQCGLAGALAALCGIALPFLLTGGLFRANHERNPWLMTALCMGATAWAIHSCFQFLEIIPGSLYVMGIVCLLAMPAEQKSEVIDTEQYTTLSITWWKSWAPAAAALALLCLLSLARLPGELHYERVSRQLDQLRTPHSATLPRPSPPSPQTLFQELEAVSRQLPFFVSAARTRYELAESVGDMAVALNAADQLIRRAPHRGTFYLRRSKILQLEGKWKEAEEDLHLAETWYPANAGLQIAKAVQVLAPRMESIVERKIFVRRALACPAHIREADSHINVFLYEENSHLPKPAGAAPLEDILNRADLDYGGKPILFTIEAPVTIEAPEGKQP